MTWLDGVIIAVLVGGLWQGRRRGLFREACHIGGALAGVYLGIRTAPSVAALIEREYGVSEALVRPVAVVLIMLIVAEIGVIAGPPLERWLLGAKSGSWLNRWGGALLGLLKYGIVLLVLLVALLRIPWPEAHQVVEESGVALRLLDTGKAVYSGLDQMLSAAAWRE